MFVGRFQRHSQKVKIQDMKGLNTLLRWIKRKPFRITYGKLGTPVGLCVIADSAYRADDDDCLALRAAILVMIEVRGGIPSGHVHVIDYCSRKQPRVTRSTFGAELTNQLEASEMRMMHRGVWHQVLTGSRGAAELHEAVNSGSIDIGLYVVGDAHAVYTAITAEEITAPKR